MGLRNTNTQISTLFVFVFFFFPLVFSQISNVPNQSQTSQNLPNPTQTSQNVPNQAQTSQNPPQPQQPPQPAASGIPEPQEFLDAHNKARTHVGQPLYVWNETLASYALAWANKRVDDCRMIHSYGPYGENIFWGAQNHWTAGDAVRSWVKEHKYYNRKTNACIPGKLCGHYTQIVWRDSIQLGCARTKCTNGGIFILCSYYPPGNYLNEHPLMPGFLYNPNGNDNNNTNVNSNQQV